MKEGGSGYAVGYLDTGWFFPPVFSDDVPNGTMILTPSTAESLFPCDITFPLD